MPRGSKRSAPALPSCSEVLDLAISRRRERCAVKTTYTHSNLLDYVAQQFDGYSIVGPLDLPSDYVSVSSFPTGEPDYKKLAYMLNTGEAEAEDQLNGHCECCAVALCDEIMQCIAHSPESSATQNLAAAYANISARLAPLSWHEQSSILFAPEQRARQTAPRHTIQMWSHSMGVVSDMLKPAQIQHPIAFLRGLCAGLDAVDVRLSEISQRCRKEGSSCAFPLYVLNYTWDGDELDDADMLVTEHESAQYSVHVVGLVVDGARGVVYVADPNGPLHPGSNVELLQLPLVRRDTPPSTAFSAFDIDQVQAAKVAKSAKKAKLKTRK